MRFKLSLAPRFCKTGSHKPLREHALFTGKELFRSAKRRRGAIAPLLLAAAGAAQAATTYLEPEAFLEQAFKGDVPEPEVVWLIGDVEAAYKAIMGHPPRELRVRYWARDGRTVWILEEIGKEKPITTGFVINDDQIKRLEVLIYRESRGAEVHYDFFTKQFIGATLQPNRELDQPIDSISGATLSVNALTNLARLALFLDSQVTPPDAS